jgi:hypothetical protein
MLMNLGRWYQRQCRQSRPRTRLQVEWLEDRVVLATFDVTNTADILNQAGTLRNAIQQANSNGQANNTINILTAGTYAITLTGTPNESDNAAGEFAVNLQSGGSLTINNQSSGAVIVDAQGASRVFDVNPGNASLAAAAQVVFNGNTGGITVTNGKAATTNDAAGSGGDIRAQGAVGLTLANVTVSNGTGGGDGGGISMENSANISWALALNHSTVTNNHAGNAGGGVEADGTGTVTVSNSLLTGNSAVNQGGGLWLDTIGSNSGTANLFITQSVISNNSAGLLGAGLGNAGNGTVTLFNSVVRGNGSSGSGGGFADENNLGTLTVSNSLFLDNSASGSGGGLFAGGPSTTISDSEFQGNSASINGGGAFLGQNGNGTPATATSAFTITNSTFAENSANGNGGGIEFETTTGTPNSTSSATLTDSTLAGNSARTGTGGGINVATGFKGSVALRADTITNNSAATTGGVAFAGRAGGTVSVQNTILAENNGTNPDVSSGAGTFSDNGNNLLGVLPTPNNTGFTAATDLKGPFTNLVSALSDNGGALAGVTQVYGASVGNSPAGNQMTVQTESLPPTSSARNKGVAIAGLTADERGVPIVTPPDAGAFQFQNASLTVTITAPTTVGLGSSATFTVTVNNTSGNALPDSNGTLVVNLRTRVSAPFGGFNQTFTIGPIVAHQSQSFTIPIDTTQPGTQTITATVTSPDANPNTPNPATVEFTVVPSPLAAHTPQGTLMVFALAIDNGQVVFLYLDQAGQVFDESFSLNNFFSPNPANAVFLNTDLVFRNIQFQDSGAFGTPGILRDVLDFNNSAVLMTTVPLNFISLAAVNDIIHALEQPGA